MRPSGKYWKRRANSGCKSRNASIAPPSIFSIPYVNFRLAVQNETGLNALCDAVVRKPRCKKHHFSKNFLHRVFCCWISLLSAVFCTVGTCVMSVIF